MVSQNALIALHNLRTEPKTRDGTSKEGIERLTGFLDLQKFPKG